MKTSYKAVLWALAAAVFTRLLLFDFMVTQGNSMEPAIKDGTVLVISKLRYGFRLPWQKKYLVRWAIPAEGEVVVFNAPSGGKAVKRCLAVAENGFFAGGDNELASYDSRSYGTVLFDSIIGKALGY